MLSISNSVTVVIPVFNEEGNLDPLFLLLEQTFEDLGFVLPVLVVDDGSRDCSASILAEMTQKYSFLEVVTHPQNKGVTAVWQTALAHTKTEWIFWGQADLESDPSKDIPLLLKACSPQVDAVAGWRQNRGDGKVFASSFANTACKVVFGQKIHDMNWIKLVRRSLVAELPLNVVSHRYILPVLKGKGYNVIEVPTPWNPRYSGKSKFGKKRFIDSALTFSKLLLWWLAYLTNNAVGSVLPKGKNTRVWEDSKIWGNESINGLNMRVGVPNNSLVENYRVERKQVGEG